MLGLLDPSRHSHLDPPSHMHRVQGQQLLQPGVSQKAAQQLMYNLETTVSVILQFMDELQEQGGGAGAGAALAGAAAAAGTGAGGRWAALQADLALGAVRVLGR